MLGLPILHRARTPVAADLAHMLDRLLASHISMQPGTTLTFAEEYIRRIGPHRVAPASRLSLSAYVWRRALEDIVGERWTSVDVRNYERALVALFLKSTDHFLKPAGQPTRYRFYADPYESGCANPLANLELDD
jgi:hypothetical protein